MRRSTGENFGKYVNENEICQRERNLENRKEKAGKEREKLQLKEI